LKTIIRLLIAALLLNAAARVGTAFWRYYDFRDAVEQAARFSEKETVATLHQRIMQLADERGIAIYPADVVVQHDTKQVTVAALYGEDIELIPRLYRREHLFEFEVNVQPVPAHPYDVK
jgi:hypothetical protein